MSLRELLLAVLKGICASYFVRAIHWTILIYLAIESAAAINNTPSLSARPDPDYCPIRDFFWSSWYPKQPKCPKEQTIVSNIVCACAVVSLIISTFRSALDPVCSKARRYILTVFGVVFMWDFLQNHVLLGNLLLSSDPEGAEDVFKFQQQFGSFLISWMGRVMLAEDILVHKSLDIWLITLTVLQLILIPPFREMESSTEWPCHTVSAKAHWIAAGVNFLVFGDPVAFRLAKVGKHIGAKIVEVEQEIVAGIEKRFGYHRS